MQASAKVLVSGFEPFGDATINASQEVVLQLQAKGLSNVETLVLGTSYENGFAELMQAITRTEPDYVLSLGESRGRASVNIENVGVNLADCDLADNKGEIKTQQVIDPSGSDAYIATVPVFELCEAVKQGGVPCSVSWSAGTYVCNYVMYKTLHCLRHASIPFGFVHIPVLPCSSVNDPKCPTMALDTSLAAIETLVAYLQKQ